MEFTDLLTSSCHSTGWSCKKDLGIYGYETPVKLLEFMVSSLKEKEGWINAVLLNGDFIHHGVAQMTYDEEAIPETWG